MADATDSDDAGQKPAQSDPLVVRPVLVFASPAVRPSRRLRGPLILLAILFGMFVGVGTFTFGYGKGYSYLSNDPQSCANCHVMQEHYDTWQMSTHHHVATCNDCHLPHDFVGKWVTKADNGFFHSISFTLQNYHDPLQIKPRNRVVTQNACIKCHDDLVHSLLGADAAFAEQSDPHSGALNCVHCHTAVGHAFHPYSTGSERE